MYSFPFAAAQVTERSIIYGLYSGAYLNLHSYLADVEATELANLLADYNAKIMELTASETNLVADIGSRRYLAGVDVVIHDQKMATKEEGINADDLLWDAKIAALSADEAALETLAAKVVAETRRTQARIVELRAYIDIEEVRLAEVDIEIAQKEIQSAKIDIAILDAANAILRIQIDTITAATKLIEIDMDIARTKASIAQTDSSIAKIDLLADDLTREEAQTTIMEGERDVASARADLAIAKSGAMDTEISFYETTLPAQATTEKNKKIELLDQRDAIRRDGLEQQQEEKTLSSDSRRTESYLGPILANDDTSSQEAIDAQRASTIAHSVRTRDAKTSAAIAAAETLAAANIATTLRHYVKKVPD